jgi:hypothetical protein
MKHDFSSNPEILFEVDTPLGFQVRTTAEYWQFIVTVKHPIMHDRLTDVQDTLRAPDEIRLSKTDSQVHLFCFIVTMVKNVGSVLWQDV